MSFDLLERKETRFVTVSRLTTTNPCAMEDALRVTALWGIMVPTTGTSDKTDRNLDRRDCSGNWLDVRQSKQPLINNQAQKRCDGGRCGLRQRFPSLQYAPWLRFLHDSTKPLLI